MNIYSASFAKLQQSFPSESETIERLQKLLQTSTAPNTAYSFKRIFDVARPNSHTLLAEILHELENMEIVKRAYVIKSEYGTSLGEYPNIMSVPLSVVDETTEREITVTRDIIEVRYEVSNV